MTDYLDTQAAADHLGVSKTFLEKKRHFGGGPEFIRVTPRCIRYRRAALEAWMSARTASSVADYPGRDRGDTAREDAA